MGMSSDPPLHIDRRAKQAAKIIENPQNYKVCVGCDSIVGIKVALCPNCHAYRFSADDKTVVSQAKVLGSREKHSVLASDLE